MRRYAFAVLAFLAIGGTAHAEGANCAPSLPADPTGDYPRLFDCVKQSIADAQAKLDTLRSLGIDDFAATANTERTQFEALVKTRSDALGAAEKQISDLVTQRDQLTAELNATHGDNDAAQRKIVALESEIDRIAGQLKISETDLVAARSKIEAQQRIIDQMAADLTTAKDTIASLASQIDGLDATSKAAAAEIADLSGKIDSLNQQATAQTALIGELKGQVAQLQVLLAKHDSDAHTETAALQAKIDELTASLEQATQKVDGLTAALAKAHDENGVLSCQMAALSDKLQSYREQFLARMREAFKNHPEIVIDRGRLIVQAEVLFPTGSAVVSPAGREAILTVAKAAKAVPNEMVWALEVNGHTDIQPIHAKYRDNWQLSTERALAVIKILQDAGMDGNHLAAAGFGQYQPLKPGKDAESWRHNRRIEFVLTDVGLYPPGESEQPAAADCKAQT